MGQPVHTVSVANASVPLANPDRLHLLMLSIATSVGGAAGAAVVVNITGQELPPDYRAFANPDQDAVARISNKTVTGFTLTLLPRLATNTLAVGKTDVLIVA